MRHFNSLEELINAKAQETHENNLYFGGVFTDNPQAAQAEGYEVMEDSGEYRISKLSTEIEYAAKKVSFVSHPFDLKRLGIASPAYIIEDFGYTLA